MTIQVFLCEKIEDPHALLEEIQKDPLTKHELILTQTRDLRRIVDPPHLRPMVRTYLQNPDLTPLSNMLRENNLVPSPGAVLRAPSGNEYEVIHVEYINEPLAISVNAYFKRFTTDRSLGNFIDRVISLTSLADRCYPPLGGPADGVCTGQPVPDSEMVQEPSEYPLDGSDTDQSNHDAGSEHEGGGSSTTSGSANDDPNASMPAHGNGDLGVASVVEGGTAIADPSASSEIPSGSDASRLPRAGRRKNRGG
jgi:hypothetical protein